MDITDHNYTKHLKRCLQTVKNAMKDQMEVLVKKIDSLYQKIEEVIDERSSKQMDFLQNEIDTNRTKLLELEIQEFYKEVDDEDD